MGKFNRYEAFMNNWYTHILLLILTIPSFRLAIAEELPIVKEEVFQERLLRFYSSIKSHRKKYDKEVLYQDSIAPHQSFLDPRKVKKRLDSIHERYLSYEEIIEQKYKLESFTNTYKPEKPQGFVSLDIYLKRYKSVDVALNRALTAGDVWLPSNRKIVLSKSISMPEGRKLASDGTATLVFDFEDDGEQRSLINILGSQDVVVKDLKITVQNSGRRYKSGIEIFNSKDITIEGVEFVGVSNTSAIIRINSSHSVKVSENLIHDSFSTMPLRQITGIEVDETRDDGVNSRNLKIKANLILGIMIDDSLFFNTELRKNGKALLYETDGINLCSTESKSFHSIENNLIVDVGEGIDSFASYGLYRDNHIERTFSYGMKFIHSSSHNKIVNNTIRYTGLSAIVISQGERWFTGNNLILNNSISFVNAFEINKFSEEIGLKQDIGAIKIEGFSQGNLILKNTVFSSVIDELYRADIVCSWGVNSEGSSNFAMYNIANEREFIAKQSNTNCLTIIK